MTEQEAFQLGFLKQAAAYGLPPDEVVKLANDGSSWLGRYLEQKALRHQTSGESPWAAVGGRFGGALTGGLAGGALGSLGGPAGVGIGAQIGSSLSEDPGEALSTQGFGPATRQESLDKAEQNLDTSSYGTNAARMAGKRALPPAVIMALLGAVGGGAMGMSGGLPGALGGAGLGAGLGGLVGGSAGATYGALEGLLNKAVHSNTSPETHARAKKTLVQHPMTSLPFGDMVGAAGK